jgi:hypothetical protein
MIETNSSSKEGYSFSPLLRFALSPILLFLLLSCSQLFSKLDDPADPKAANYQGYPTVMSSAEIQPVSPVDGGTLVGITLTIPRVNEATAYELVLATTSAALATNSAIGFASNVMDLSAMSIADLATYFWKARAKEASGSWGTWSQIASFSTSFQPAATPTFSPIGGINTTDQNVMISCGTANATIYFTTNGDALTTGSTQYTGTAISATVNPATTIKAIAMVTGYLQSAVGLATYHKPYAVGDTGPAGGIIFYDKGSLTNGWRFLEAAPSDQSTGIQWYNGSHIHISTGTAIGTGKANTDAIIAAQENGSYAASLCKNLSLGGYSDWFLPSKDEFNLMYMNLKQVGLGGFGGGWFWSSSQTDDYDGWLQDISIGNQYSYTTSHDSSVRACRAF